MGKPKMFPEKLDIKLIELVRDNPIIYNHNDLKYMDYDTREVVWQKIGDELQRPAGDCKNRWVNIRDSYRRLLKLVIKTPEKRHKPYKYDKMLLFLKPYLKDITLIDDDDDNEFPQDDDYDMDSNKVYVASNDVEDDSDYEAKPVKIAKKKKVAKRKKLKREDKEAASTCTAFEAAPPSELDSSDPVDAFLLSIGATLKNFSPYHLNIAKSKIFAIVQEHELQQIVDSQNHDAQSEDMKNNMINL